MHAVAAGLAWSLSALLLTAAGSQVAREEAIARLHQVFGMPSREASPHQHHDVPPQYMTELYNAVAEPTGLTKGSNPYNAKVVRSFIERDNSKEQFFIFNISGLGPDEYVLEAELHIYRKRTPLGQDHRFSPSSPDCLLHVYQVTDDEALSQPDVQRLLSVHYLSMSSSGWLVANVKQAVLDWVSGARPNLGLLVVASSLFGEPVSLNFARRNQHHNSKQPILVLFNGDRRSPPAREDGHLPSTHISDTDESVEDDGQAAAQRIRRSLAAVNSSEDVGEAAAHRTRRSLAAVNNREDPDEARLTHDADNTASAQYPCTRQPFNVKFKDIGWNSWIISPLGYNAYQCKGHCDFPLGQNQGPTNHATVQSIVHELKLEDVSKPCCVPTALRSLSLLFYDEHTNIVLKNYEDMVAEACGCH